MVCCELCRVDSDLVSDTWCSNATLRDIIYISSLLYSDIEGRSHYNERWSNNFERPTSPPPGSKDGATYTYLLVCVNWTWQSHCQLVDLAQAQDVEAGDGTTSVIVLAGSLLGAAEKMLAKGMHHHWLLCGAQINNISIVLFILLSLQTLSLELPRKSFSFSRISPPLLTLRIVTVFWELLLRPSTPKSVFLSLLLKVRPLMSL